MSIHPLVLRNKGVPVEVFALDTDDSGRPIVRLDGGEEGAPVVEKAWVRLDSNAICDLEDEFGSLDGFEKAMSGTSIDGVMIQQPKTFRAVRSGLAAALGIDAKRAGVMMDGGRLAEYANALSMSMALANGVDPTKVAQLWERGIRAIEENKITRNADIDERLGALSDQDNDSPGTNGSEPGVPLVAASTSSGD